MTLTADRFEIRQRAPEQDRSSENASTYTDGPLVGLNLEEGTFGVRVGREVGEVTLCVLQDRRNPAPRKNNEFPLRDVIETANGGIILAGEVSVPRGAAYGLIIDGSKRVYTDPRAKQVRYIPTGRGTELDVISVASEEPSYQRKHNRPSIDDLRIYEAHMKGFTARHPGVPQELKGTYAGMAKVGPKYLSKLGMNAVELLPIQPFNRNNAYAVERGLRDYWGYNPDAWFAPDPGYAGTNRPISEVTAMFDAFHREGLAVIMDVVYNHTGVDSRSGIGNTLRALNKNAFHEQREDDPIGFSGCGESPNLADPMVLNLVLDSLREWVAKGADGFRFDLFTTLLRDQNGHVTMDHPFAKAIRNDEILSDRIMIGEPWDLGPYGYQGGNVGRLPGLREWNDQAKHARRDFWKGDGTAWESELNAMGKRASDRDKPGYRGVAYLCTHDGFTLRDTVSYNNKHNEASGQRNENGEDYNRSWNSGVEGPTRDPEIRALRLRRMMSMQLDLILTDSDIMILGGDEAGNSRGGHNDPWSLDNETSWQDWSEDDPEARILRDFVSAGMKWREASGYFGEAAHTRHDKHGKPLGMRQDTSYNVWGGEMVDGEKGSQVIGQGLSDSFQRRGDYIGYKNGSHTVHEITLPDDATYKVIFDTAERTGMPATPTLVSGKIRLPKLAAVLLEKTS